MGGFFQKIRIFYGETKQELKKASWPTRMELRDSTIVVVLAVILLGAYVSWADWSVYNFVTLLTKIVRPDS